jgi:hypothetical protein
MVSPSAWQKMETLSPRSAYRMTCPPRLGALRRASELAVTTPRVVLCWSSGRPPLSGRLLEPWSLPVLVGRPELWLLLFPVLVGRPELWLLLFPVLVGRPELWVLPSPLPVGRPELWLLVPVLVGRPEL